MGCGWGDRLNKTKRIITCALLTTVALALFAVELLIPPFSFCPGAKIGLANIITLFMLSNRKFFRVSDCFGVSVIKMYAIRSAYRAYSVGCIQSFGRTCFNVCDASYKKDNE